MKVSPPVEVTAVIRCNAAWSVYLKPRNWLASWGLAEDGQRLRKARLAMTALGIAQSLEEALSAEGRPARKLTVTLQAVSSGGPQGLNGSRDTLRGEVCIEGEMMPAEAIECYETRVRAMELFQLLTREFAAVNLTFATHSTVDLAFG